MPSPPRNAISEQKTCIEMNIMSVHNVGRENCDCWAVAPLPANLNYSKHRFCKHTDTKLLRDLKLGQNQLMTTTLEF
jgi:hypothetical protein